MAGPMLREKEYLKTMCWCDTRIVSVPTADVRAGRTRSCGLWSCRPPEEKPVPVGLQPTA